jgi:hypothetical protein
MPDWGVYVGGVGRFRILVAIRGMGHRWRITGRGVTIRRWKMGISGPLPSGLRTVPSHISKMIVTYRPKPRKRPVKAPTTVITGPRIVSAKLSKRSRTPTERTPDPEADARVAAFFARMIRSAS